jgi:hypothetical protein
MASDHACKIFDTKDTLSHTQKHKLTTRMHVHPGGDVLIDLDLLGNKRGGADVVDPNLDFSALVMYFQYLQTNIYLPHRERCI